MRALRISSPRLVLAVGIAVALLISAAVVLTGRASGAGAELPLSELKRPMTLNDELPQTVAPSDVDRTQARRANALGPVTAYLAPDKTGDRICLIAVVDAGPTAHWGASCNAPDVLESWGAIPLIVQTGDGALFFVGAVADGYSSLRDAGAFSAGSVEGNVAIMPVKPQTQTLVLGSASGTRSLPVGALLGDAPTAAVG